MTHYDYIEWIFYKEKVFPKEKMIKMEEHLYTCSECMDIFLSLIDAKEVNKAEEFLSQDFTDGVMKSIENIKHIPKSKVKKSNINYRDVFTYYVAVASVAIVLTLGGFYSGLVDMVPRVTQSTTIKAHTNLPNMVVDISGKIVNRTSDFINNFEISNMKEDVR